MLKIVALFGVPISHGRIAATWLCVDTSYNVYIIHQDIADLNSSILCQC